MFQRGCIVLKPLLEHFFLKFYFSDSVFSLDSKPTDLLEFQWQLQLGYVLVASACGCFLRPWTSKIVSVVKTVISTFFKWKPWKLQRRRLPRWKRPGDIAVAFTMSTSGVPPIRNNCAMSAEAKIVSGFVPKRPQKLHPCPRRHQQRDHGEGALLKISHLSVLAVTKCHVRWLKVASGVEICACLEPCRFAPEILNSIARWLADVSGLFGDR